MPLLIPPDVSSAVDRAEWAAAQMRPLEAFKARGHIAGTGFSAPSWVDNIVYVFSDACIAMLWPPLSTFSVFTRLPV
jgi:hypothetical protein